jgi:putative peptide zinc metalloprotease protein
MTGVGDCFLLPERPELRKDLEIVPRLEAGEGFRYLVKDPVSGSVYEFSAKEYFLFQAFNGQNPIASIKACFEQEFGVSIEIAQLKAFVRQLTTLGLLYSGTKKDTVRFDKTSGYKSWHLLDPDRILAAGAKNLRGCFSQLFLAVFLLILSIAVVTGIQLASNFLWELSSLVGTNWYFLVPLLSVVVISPLVEISKGIACVYYGGKVHGYRVELVYRVIPRFYCEMSDALYAMKNTERIRVFAAGLVCQSLLWAVGVILWVNTDLASQVHTFWLFFTLTSTFLLFLRINPLIELDGYHVLSAWLEIPDLRNRARSLTESWILREPVPEPLSTREKVIFRRYGLLSFGFEIFFWGALLGLIGYHLIHSLGGMGAGLFLIILFLRFEKSLTKHNMKKLFLGNIVGDERGTAKLRLLARLGIYGAFILVMFVPYPLDVGGEFKLLPIAELGVRVQVSGEVEAVFAREGEWVKKGQLLAILSSREQTRKGEEAKAAIEEAEANLRLLQSGPKPEEIAKAEQEVRAAAKSLEYSTSQANRAEQMFKAKAIPEKDYENALRVRDMDRERYESSRKQLELVKSGFRDEQINAVKAEIRRLNVELSHAEELIKLARIYSPMEGTVITPQLSEKIGQYLATGELLAVIEDARTLVVEVEVPEEDIEEVKIGAEVKVRTWASPTTVYSGRVKEIATVAYEKSRRRIERGYSDREWLIEQNEIIREKGRVVRVLAEIDNPEGILKTDMTGYAKIACRWQPVGIAYTRWLIRFLFVEFWSWIP